MVPSPRIAARATSALNSVEKLRRLAIFWNPYSQAGFHLIALPDIRAHFFGRSGILPRII